MLKNDVNIHVYFCPPLIFHTSVAEALFLADYLLTTAEVIQARLSPSALTPELLR